MESVAAPAVAAGTESRTLTSRLSCGRTVTCESRRTTECGLPASSCVETVKVADASPKFLSVTVSRSVKSRSSSAKPKFSAAVPVAECDDLRLDRGQRLDEARAGPGGHVAADLRGIGGVLDRAFQYLTRRHVGCACFTSAATPAAGGAAIDVPDMVAERLPVPSRPRRSLRPGPVRSGLSQLSPERGPNEPKLARLR